MGNINNDGFIKSKNIWVFPCSYRTVNIESRINSEYNLTHTTGLGLKKSYIVSINEETGIFEVVIGGYYFRFNLSDEDKGYTWAAINFVSAEIDNSEATDFKDSEFLKNLKTNLNTPTILDEENYFYGIKFFKVDTPPTEYPYRLNFRSTGNENFSLDYNSIGSLQAGKSIIGDFYYDDTDSANLIIKQIEVEDPDTQEVKAKDINITGNVNLNKAVTIEKELTTKGKSTLNKLVVNDGSELHNTTTFIADSDSTETEEAKIAEFSKDGVIINKNLTAEGKITLNNTLEVKKQATFKNNVEVGTILTKEESDAGKSKNNLISYADIIVATETYNKDDLTKATKIEPEKFTGHNIQADEISIGKNTFDSDGNLYIYSDTITIKNENLNLKFKKYDETITLSKDKIKLPGSLEVTEDIETKTLTTTTDVKIGDNVILKDAEIQTPKLILKENSDGNTERSITSTSEYLKIEKNNITTNIKLPDTSGTIYLANNPTNTPSILVGSKDKTEWISVGNNISTSNDSDYFLVGNNDSIGFKKLDTCGKANAPIYIKDGNFAQANTIPTVNTDKCTIKYKVATKSSTKATSANYDDATEVSYKLNYLQIDNTYLVYGLVQQNIQEDRWVKFELSSIKINDNNNNTNLQYASVKPDLVDMPDNTHVSYINYTDITNNCAYYKVTENNYTQSYFSVFFVLKINN